MAISRRGFASGLAFLGLSACVGGGGAAVSVPGPAPAPRANAGYDAWLAGFRARAAKKGIRADVLNSAFRGAGFLPEVIEKDRNQTEFTRTLEDYLAIAVSSERLSMGQAALARHGGTLRAIESRYGVEAEVVTAIWGLESKYGTRRGDIPVISALSTLAYDGRRGAFFEKQLLAALRILQSGDISPARMTGSWAGAMGHTQFIPTSYLAYAVDFTGDGRRDIWSDDPSDALASTASYLKNAGWKKGQPWGIEVRLPTEFDMRLMGRGKGKSTESWRALGVTAANGGRLPDHGAGSIIRPEGNHGPAFLIYSNFNAIARYNNAVSYVVGVGHLSDRLRGGATIQASFPPDAAGLSLQDRQEIQRRLTAMGFDTQGTDGVVGNNTRAAIRAYQAARGQAQTGEPTLALLNALRRGV